MMRPRLFAAPSLTLSRSSSSIRVSLFSTRDFLKVSVTTPAGASTFSLRCKDDPGFSQGAQEQPSVHMMNLSRSLDDVRAPSLGFAPLFSAN